MRFSLMRKKRIKLAQGMENKFIKQLFVGCGDKECLNAFCLVVETQAIVVAAAEKLLQYGDLFQCGNKKELLEYKSNKYFNVNKTNKGPSIDFINVQYTDNVLLEFALDILNLANRRDSIKNISNTYCEMMKKEHDGLNYFFMKNIFLVLLDKYNDDPWYTLGLIILRVFITFESYNFLSDENIMRICNIFMHIHTNQPAMLNILNDINVYEKENLDMDTYTIKDFIQLVNSFSNVLDNIKEPSIRLCSYIEDLLNVFTVQFLFNEQFSVFSYKKFYLPNFCRKHNLREEFRFFRSDCKSILRYNFILPLEIKAEYLKHEHSDSMKNSLQDAFFRALFEGPKEPYLFLTVGRQTIYKETFDLLRNIKPADLRKQLKITFKNEEGIDSGGIKKEFFQLLSEELQEDPLLFEIKNNYLWIKSCNDNEKLDDYVTLGKLIGIALYNDMILNLPFPNIFFKKLLDKDLEFSDLSEIEPAIFSSLQNLKNASEDEIRNLDLTFIVPYNGTDIRLAPKSEDKVTVHNLDTFIDLFTDYILNKSVNISFRLIKKGFDSIIKKKPIIFLQPNELEKIIVGSTFIDVKKIRQYSITNGFDESDETVGHFWEIFEEYKYEEKKAILQFITGNDRIPVSGAENLKMVIMKNGCDTDRLPSAQTCFNTLLLPKYKSKEKLKEKLNKAITMTKGFYLL